MAINIKELVADTFLSLSDTRRIQDIQIAEIIKGSGVSRQTFYNHFHNKDDLICYIYRERIIGHKLECAIQEDYTRGRQFYYRRLKEHEKLFRQVVRRDAEEFVQYMIASHLHLVLRYLHVKRGIEEPDTELHFASEYMAHANGYLSYEWLRGKMDISPDDMARYDADVLSDVLRGYFLFPE